MGHRWYLVMYMLLFLCLSNARRTFSLDAYLTEALPRWWLGLGFGAAAWPFDPRLMHPVFSTGLATKLGLFATSFSLWSGAWAKLYNGGLRWLDGRTLSWCVLSARAGAAPVLKAIFLHPVLAGISATIAVVFEAGSCLVTLPAARPWRALWMLACFKVRVRVRVRLGLERCGCWPALRLGLGLWGMGLGACFLCFC